MKKLILMMGLPRSGKSTIARTLGHPIVSPDAIRMVMYGQPLLVEREPEVWREASFMVDVLFQAGHETVVLDATNVTRHNRNFWLSHEDYGAQGPGKWENHILIVSTPVEVCLDRARALGQDYLLPVIEAMSKSWTEPEDYWNVHEWCPGCNKETDPKTCWCGDPTDKHDFGSGHSPVSMGCTCLYA